MIATDNKAFWIWIWKVTKQLKTLRFVSSFRINSTSGSVSVMSNQTDREREDRYYMVVVATDGGGLQQTVPLTINITDSNDNPPIFLRDQYDVILDEGATQFRHSASVKLEVGLAIVLFSFFTC